MHVIIIDKERKSEKIKLIGSFDKIKNRITIRLKPKDIMNAIEAPTLSEVYNQFSAYT